jgi:uncharacterized membrane protein YgaE (UPF0421/DUF939 family)
MTQSFSEAIQAGWGRVAGIIIGGIAAAITLTCLGDHPIFAAMSYIVTMLLIEMLQWKASAASALLLFPLLFIDTPHGQYPWHYIYDRVRYNSIGVLIGTLVMAFFWRDRPRETLSNHLVQIFTDIDQGFQVIVFSHLQREQLSAQIKERLDQMQTLLQESQSLLKKSSYGIAGNFFIRDNWSELIASQERLVRYLSIMGQTYSERENLLSPQFTAPLTHLVEQVSPVFTTLSNFVASGSVNQPQFDISLLSEDVLEITEQLRQLRTNRDFLKLPLLDIIRFYTFLDALTRFTQELQQLGQYLHTRQVANRQNSRIGLSLKLHPLQGDIVKQHLRAGLALGIVSALVRYFDLFDIKRWAIFLALSAMPMIRPTWGTTVNMARITALSFVLIVSICYLFIKTLGTNDLAIALAMFAITYICLALKIEAGFQLSAKNVLVFMLITPSNSPTFYVDCWNLLKISLAGISLALLISRLFWPTTATQKLKLGISQTFTELGDFYQTVVNNYLQGMKKSDITPFTQSILQSIQNHVSLQGTIAQEVSDNAVVVQAKQRWNFLISYEKKLLYDLVSLQNAIQYDSSGQIAQVLFLELQELAQQTTAAFEELGAAVGAELPRNEFPTLLTAVNNVIQRLESLRTQGHQEFTLDEIVTFSSILSNLKEITENLNQMAQNWSSSNGTIETYRTA